MNTNGVLKAGALAVLDSFAGPVPCKVEIVTRGEHGQTFARVKFTATRGAYLRGEVETHPTRYVVPRESIYRRDLKLCRAPYRVEVTA